MHTCTGWVWRPHFGFVFVCFFSFVLHVDTNVPQLNCEPIRTSASRPCGCTQQL